MARTDLNVRLSRRRSRLFDFVPCRSLTRLPPTLVKCGVRGWSWGLRSGTNMSGVALLRGRRVLVVEDEAMLSLMLGDLLASVGGVVVGPAGSTTQALDLIEQEVVDCAILDIKLADGNSVPVAEALAARGIPFVVATGYEGIPPGYNGARVLRKVYLSDEVVEAIADILRP